MANRREKVNWSDKKDICDRISSAKGAVTRACTTIEKLKAWPFTYATTASCDEARRRLQQAYDFCVELHDRWGDLGDDEDAKESVKSLKPYEDKYFTAMQALEEYIASNATAARMTARRALTPGKGQAIIKQIAVSQSFYKGQHPGRVQAMDDRVPAILRCQ